MRNVRNSTLMHVSAWYRCLHPEWGNVVMQPCSRHILYSVSSSLPHWNRRGRVLSVPSHSSNCNGKASANNLLSYSPACICMSVYFSSIVGCFVVSRTAICALQSFGQHKYRLSHKLSWLTIIPLVPSVTPLRSLHWRIGFLQEYLAGLCSFVNLSAKQWDWAGCLD